MISSGPRRNDDDQRSYRALERSDIPDAAEASELFPEKWRGVVIQQGPARRPLLFSVPKARSRLHWT
jgi:hypothetical protein